MTWKVTSQHRRKKKVTSQHRFKRENITSQEVSSKGWQKKHAVRILQNLAHHQLVTLLGGKLCLKNISRALHCQMRCVPFPVVTKWINIVPKRTHDKQCILSSEEKFNSGIAKCIRIQLINTEHICIQQNFTCTVPTHHLKMASIISSNTIWSTSGLTVLWIVVLYNPWSMVWLDTLVTLLPAFPLWTFVVVFRKASNRCTCATTKFAWIRQSTDQHATTARTVPKIETPAFPKYPPPSHPDAIPSLVSAKLQRLTTSTAFSVEPRRATNRGNVARPNQHLIDTPQQNHSPIAEPEVARRPQERAASSGCGGNGAQRGPICTDGIHPSVGDRGMWSGAGKGMVLVL